MVIKTKHSKEDLRHAIREEFKVLDPIWAEIGKMIESLHNRLNEVEGSMNTVIRKLKENE